MNSAKIQKEIIAKLVQGKKVIGASFFPGKETIVQVTDSFFAFFPNQGNNPQKRLFIDSSLLTNKNFQFPNDAETLYESHKLVLSQTGLLKFGRNNKLLRQFVKKNHKQHVVFTVWIDNKIFSYFGKNASLTFIRSQTMDRISIYVYENTKLCGIIIPEEVEGK